MEQILNLFPINSFRGEYFFLSNFYEAPVEYDGITYQSNEAAYQAQKCADKKDREQFADASPGDAKRLGRKVHLRPDWEDVKVSIMRDIVTAKFEQNPDLRERLMHLKNIYLEEGNTWGDRIWGVTYDEKGKHGQNLLGQILMDVRDEFIKAAEEKEYEIDR